MTVLLAKLIKVAVSQILPRKPLLSIYKVILRPPIDYRDIIYYQPHHNSFGEKLESAQYKALLAITGVIQDTFRKKVFQELVY